MSGSKRAKVSVVTAYVPIENHTRTAEEYGKLGEHFLAWCPLPKRDKVVEREVFKDSAP